ncbi:MAG: cytochrome c oxidase subunit II, partial [Calditrichae bacterium]|nr:cytochrome c oxidase subunit II [Calditrichia bacterium]
MKVEDFTSQVEGAFLIIVAISVVLLVGITIAMIYFVFRYHHTRHKTPKDIHGNLSLEIIWTVIPTIIVLGMFYYGWVGYRTMDRIPENALTVETIGRMWSWSFTYENGVQT